MGNPTVVDILTTQQGYTTNEKPIDMESKVHTQYAALTPLLVIGSKAGQGKTLTQTTARWMNREKLPLTFKASGSANSSDTSLTVNDYSQLRKNDAWKDIETDEVILVGATPSTSTVTIQRGWGSSTAAAINANDTFIALNTAWEEGADYSTPRSVVDSEDYNYVQYTKESTRTTLLDNATTTWQGGAGEKRAKNIRDMFRAFKEKAEITLMFGELAAESATSSTNFNFTAGGLNYFLKTADNVMNVNGVLTESRLNNWLVDSSAQMPDITRRALFTSKFVCQKISEFGTDKIRLSPSSKNYGLNIRRYLAAQEEIDVVPCPLLDQLGVKGTGWLVDLDRFYLKYMEGFKPQIKLNVREEGNDYLEDQCTAAWTLILPNKDKAHASFYGMTG